MSQSRITFNVHAQNIVDNGAFWQVMRAFNPKALHILDDGGTAVTGVEKLPNTEIIYRFNGDGGDDGEALLKYQPKELLAKLGPKVNNDKRIILSIGNEMTLNERTIKFLCDMIKQANIDGWRLGVLSLAVGNPKGDDPIGAWAVAKPLLQLLAEHRQHYLFLHEYFFVVPTSGYYGGWPDNAGVTPGKGGGLDLVPADNWPHQTQGITQYHCGRFKFLLAYCDKEGIPYPRIGLTEHGEDELNDIKDWSNKLERMPGVHDFKGWRHCERAWRTLYSKKGWSPQRAYAEMLIYLDKYVYQNSPVEWQCIFSMFQSSAEWGPFNVWGESEFLDPIVLYAKETEATPMPFPLPQDSRWIPGENYSGENYRIRLMAQTDDTPELGWVKAGEKFAYIGIEGNDQWMFGKNLSGTIGYISRDVLNIAPKPTPVPPPAPPALSRVSIQEQIAAANASISTLTKYRAVVNVRVQELEDELSAERHLSNALQDSIELQKLILEWLDELMTEVKAA